MKSQIKCTWIVCSMDGVPLAGKNGETEEFTTETRALKRAGQWVRESSESEAWVYRLSHVVSRPDADPIVEAVRA